MIKRLLQVGLILAGFASMPSWAILINDGGAYDETDVGLIDTFIAEADKAGSETAEEIWVNSILTSTTVTWTVKTGDIAYYSTDGITTATDGTTTTGNVFAFQLASAPDYFLVKNGKRMALFENLLDINWGVFDTSFLSSDMNLPSSGYEISHVTGFNSAVPEPGMVGLLAIGLLGMVVTRRRMKL